MERHEHGDPGFWFPYIPQQQPNTKKKKKTDGDWIDVVSSAPKCAHRALLWAADDLLWRLQCISQRHFVRQMPRDH